MITRPPQVLSDSKTYEYAFRRVWNPDAPLALWVMRNPSVIDNIESGDDPVPSDGRTVARCAALSRQQGWGGLVTWNLFAYRIDDGAELESCDDPVGPDNDAMLHRLLDEADVIVAAWGAKYPRQYADRVNELRDTLRARGARCLGLTKNGEPRHPLYIPNDTEFVSL